jgi:short-subunit dehydrogenase
MARIAAITGARAGVGRATVEEFGRQGWDVALLARDRASLEAAATSLRDRYGVRSLPIAVDVADAGAVEDAASRIEAELGSIDVWVNVAMATVFAPALDISPEEFKRATEVTYLGQVHGTMAALRRMRGRNRGTIVNVGSALAYRAIPLQSAYCGAKFAVRGFTESLRSEILHDKLDVHLTMVHLPAVNTPQFERAPNKTGRQAQPVPPIFQPEVAARAIYFAATHRRRQIWVGFPTVRAILASRIVPGLIDRYLAKAGYSRQLMDQPRPAAAPSNLFAPVAGNYGAHGRFDARAREGSWTMVITRHPNAFWAMLATFDRARLVRCYADAGRPAKSVRSFSVAAMGAFTAPPSSVPAAGA